jgi:hypothetical protein
MRKVCGATSESNGRRAQLMREDLTGSMRNVNINIQRKRESNVTSPGDSFILPQSHTSPDVLSAARAFIIAFSRHDPPFEDVLESVVLEGSKSNFTSTHAPHRMGMPARPAQLLPT